MGVHIGYLERLVKTKIIKNPNFPINQWGNLLNSITS